MTIRRSSVFVFALATLIAVSGCSLIGSEQSTSTPTDPASPTPAVAPTETPELSPTPEPTTIPTPSPTLEPTPRPTPSPTVTPEPEALRRTVTESPCCGLFAWLSDQELLVYDDTPDEQAGAWNVNVQSGERRFVAGGFGVPSLSGVIAFPDPRNGEMVVRDHEGNQVGRVQRSERFAWPSPNGELLAGLEQLPIETPSSSVNRSVRLWVADVSSGETREILDLQAAEVNWLPDNRHLLVPARNLDFKQAGIWLIDIQTGEYEVLLEEVFLQAIRLSPDGRRVAMMRTFQDDPAQNGVWVMDIESREMTPIVEQGSFRWGADSESLWVLALGDSREETDRLVRIDVRSGERVEEYPLGARVLNDVWRISPSGDYVAFWREEDRQVVVHEVPR